MKLYVDLTDIQQTSTTTEPNKCKLSIEGVSSREECEKVADWLFRNDMKTEMRKLIELEEKE